MNFEEFLKPNQEGQDSEEFAENVDEGEGVAEEEAIESIEVQKAVVESLAADKAEQDELIKELQEKIQSLEGKIKALEERNKALSEEKNTASKPFEEKIKTLSSEGDNLRARIENLKKNIEEQNKALANFGDILARNSDTPLSNKVSLLDREEELSDRFPGETREHVLEVLIEARDKAEADGRLRRAQILEGVLTGNSPEGSLKEKRAALEKLFVDNGNILSGPVIEELVKMGISYKNGEEYLLPAEIIKRAY